MKLFLAASVLIASTFAIAAYKIDRIRPPEIKNSEDGSAGRSETPDISGSKGHKARVLPTLDQRHRDSGAQRARKPRQTSFSTTCREALRQAFFSHALTARAYSLTAIAVRAAREWPPDWATLDDVTWQLDDLNIEAHTVSVQFESALQSC